MTITCSRCGLEKEAVVKTAFYTGDTKLKLQQHACVDCWKDWLRTQTMLVNEYRLNLMDPKTDAFLNTQVLVFFKLDNTTDFADVKFVPPDHTSGDNS
jgi:Fe-S cluster biosynthesis and repair protein YggX